MAKIEVKIEVEYNIIQEQKGGLYQEHIPEHIEIDEAAIIEAIYQQVEEHIKNYV